MYYTHLLLHLRSVQVKRSASYLLLHLKSVSHVVYSLTCFLNWSLWELRCLLTCCFIRGLWKSCCSSLTCCFIWGLCNCKSCCSVSHILLHLSQGLCKSCCSSLTCCFIQGLCKSCCSVTHTLLHLSHGLCSLKEGRGCLISPPCLESQGFHLIPLCYLLSCSSA